VPTVWLPAGGYHKDAWRVLAGTAMALAARSADPIPASYDPLGARFRHISAEMGAQELGEIEFTSGGTSEAAATDYSDFFSTLFGNFSHRGASTRIHGEDHHAKIFIALEDAFHGGTHTITLRSPQVDAQGRVVLRERSLNVQIPKGIRESQHIRLAGQGAPGIKGTTPGDLYLEIHFHPHPLYQVQGRDLSLSLPIAPWEAALGATVKTPTPTGVVEVKIPPGSQSGRKLRLKGRGIPGEPAGDLYIALEVVLPKADTEQAQQIYQAMARELAFNPREALGV